MLGGVSLSEQVILSQLDQFDLIVVCESLNFNLHRGGQLLFHSLNKYFLSFLVPLRVGLRDCFHLGRRVRPLHILRLAQVYYDFPLHVLREEGNFALVENQDFDLRRVCDYAQLRRVDLITT